MGKVLAGWEPYRPSNGTEGMMFHEAWCDHCARDVGFGKGPKGNGRGCRILAETFFYDIDHPLYPKEWIRQSNDDSWPGTARCTAFVPMAELSNRAKRAWETRRANRDAASHSLFEDTPHD